MNWKRIPGFEAYEINPCGRVRRADTGYVIKRSGHRVALWRDGKRFYVAIRPLVDQLFAGAPAVAPEMLKTAPEAPKAEPVQAPEATEWAAISRMPGFEVNRRGEVRNAGTHKAVVPRVPPTSKANIPYVQVYTQVGCRASQINVLLHETFGPGAAEAAGFTKPNMKIVQSIRGRRVKEKRRTCHDCGKPTNNYRCESCWRRVRGFGAAEAEEVPAYV